MSETATYESHPIKQTGELSSGDTVEIDIDGVTEEGVVVGVSDGGQARTVDVRVPRPDENSVRDTEDVEHVTRSVPAECVVNYAWFN